MAKPELGTKRTCPETGKNFYDLNKDPVVSPYTDKEYPLSFFITEVEQRKSKVEAAKTPDKPKNDTENDDDDDVIEDDDGPEIISLEDADVASGDDDDDDDDDDDEIGAIADLPTVDIDDDDDDDDDLKSDDDTFLEDEDEDTDLSDVIGNRDSSDKDEV